MNGATSDIGSESQPATRAGRRCFGGAGYVRLRSYWRMVHRLDDVAHARTAPVGVGLRPLDVDGDAAALHGLDALSFAANPDYEPESFRAFCEEHLRAHDLDAELSCVAEHRDSIVGFLLARRRQDEAVGYVDLLVVHPDQRGRGLGTALLRTAFVRFAS